MPTSNDHVCLFQPVDLIIRDQHTDKLLRFHKMCPAMEEHTENKVNTYARCFAIIGYFCRH